MTAGATLKSLADGALRAGGPAVHVGRLRLFGTRAWIAYTRNDAEWARRSDGSALTDLELLNALMNLPRGMAIPTATVGAADRRVLRRAPATAVSWPDQMVLRLAAPPVVPVLAMVRSLNWRSGVVAASRFASYCPRMVITAELPKDSDVALAEADLYGIGVAVTEAGSPRVLVAPEQLEDWRPTPVGWWFAEEIFRQQHADSR